MPVSHSHQFLCVPCNPETTVDTCTGFAGSLVSHTSCAALPYVRSMNVRPGAFGKPVHTRTIWAPPVSPEPGSPGMWVSNFGCAGSVTSRIDVPLSSFLPLSGLTEEPP